MKVLELFAGSRSIGKAAERLGHKVFSVDWGNFPDIDLRIDIANLQPGHIPFVPDYIHMSPDCSTYSVIALGIHRDGIKAKTEKAMQSDRVVTNALKLLRYYQEKNKRLLYSIENPMGMMRKMPFMIGLPRATVWYCKYGDTRAKPTDIWSNNLFSLFNQTGWVPRPPCYNSNRKCHHAKVARGTEAGTVALKNSFERSRIPDALCDEIMIAATKNYDFRPIIFY